MYREQQQIYIYNDTTDLVEGDLHKLLTMLPYTHAPLLTLKIE